MADIDTRDTQEQPTEAAAAPPVRERQKALTIGAVCKQLEREFPDISISKIRYLEDQKLLAPRRTQGGYRLYTPGDLARLRTILRLQRDEFLPLRVIRQELAGGWAEPAGLPHLRRPRGRAARADPGAGAPVAEPRAAQGGGRGAQEPGGDRVAPQVPAAGPGPAQHRRLRPCGARSARHARSPQ